MEFNVTRLNHGLVPPLEPTPSGMLDLSIIDRQPVLRCNARTLHVFKHGGSTSAEVIRRALSKALVPYYPLAGRLMFRNPRAEILCSGEGIWFVEACADHTLEEMKYFENAMCVPIDTIDKLLPTHPNEADGLDPLVLMQITKFKCNGFVMGLTFCHTICDGVGAAQFLKAVGEMTQCTDDKPSITPSWSRGLIQSPPLEAYLSSFPKMPLPPPTPTYQLEHVTMDIPLDFINRQKQDFKTQNEGLHCSSFEIVAASLWKHRTRAISDALSEETEMKLVFFANCRPFVQTSLPQGYYGNCFFPVTITASNGFLNGASIVQVVTLIQKGKADLPNEFTKWINNGVGQGVDPFLPPMLYTTLFISEWGRLGFNEVDYGFGLPVHVVPIQGSNIIPVGIVSCLPSSRVGFRLMTWCVEKTHLQALAQWHTDQNKEGET